jgi:Fe-S cluster biogenesis protein NfuA
MNRKAAMSQDSIHSPKPATTAGSAGGEPSSVFARVAQVIDRIRPAVQSDGGDLELVEVTDDGVVRVRLHGACVGCPSSSMTLQMGI